MARMIPAVPREINPYSREDEMFKALERLGDEYTVVHSFTVLNVKNATIIESESDFVVIHPDKGILFIEAKASVDGYMLERGEWYYKNGRPMKYGSPMKQAERAMRNFEDKVKQARQLWLPDRFHTSACIWLLSIDRRKLESMNLPSDVDSHLILTEDDLLDIGSAIERVFSYRREREKRSRIDSKSVETLLENFICPEFDLVPSTGYSLTEKKLVFNRLLEEQSRLLDYLIDQPVGVINGAAGTGKTMLAVEMARRYAKMGERTLFLCYNRMLCEHLKAAHSHELIDYYNIDSYAVKLSPSNNIDYMGLRDALIDRSDDFPYRHIIVDEGQDFGKEKIEEAELFELFEQLVTDGDKNGTFFIFYDSNQLIQAYDMPEYIERADCRLTLYRNSRNTYRIAQTSVKTLVNTRNIRSSDKCIEGDTPRFMFAETAEDAKIHLDREIGELLEAGYSNIQILTLKTEEKSILAPFVKSDGKYRIDGHALPFTTCRKFKGLEADAIILADVDRNVFEDEEDKRIFYVGTSRARLALSIISTLSEEDCKALISEYDVPKSSRSAYKTIVHFFQCSYQKPVG